MVQCPLCDAAIDIEEDELDEGDIFSCEECGAEIQVVGVNPLELEPVEEEDLEDEDDSFDEEDEEDDEAQWR